MHVALIYHVVKLFLNFLLRKKRRKGLFLFIGAFAVWFFAALTGFSASVTRAAFMMTFFVIIDAMQWRYNKTNVVAGSLLLLAFYDPFLFKQLGFQLSLAAVLGILYLYPHLKIQVSRKRWIQYAFDFCLVSLVAQLATLPITLATFHSFPTYFLIANILCVPISTFLIYAGIALLLLQSVPGASDFIAMLIHYAFRAFIEIVDAINQLPLQKLNNIPFNSLQEILFILGLILFGISFESRWKSGRNLSFATIAFALTFHIRTAPPLVQSNLIEDDSHIHYFIKHPDHQYNKLLQLNNYLETNRIYKPIEVHLIPPYHSLEISP